MGHFTGKINKWAILSLDNYKTNPEVKHDYSKIMQEQKYVYIWWSEDYNWFILPVFPVNNLKIIFRTRVRRTRPRVRTWARVQVSVRGRLETKCPPNSGQEHVRIWPIQSARTAKLGGHFCVRDFMVYKPWMSRKSKKWIKQNMKVKLLVLCINWPFLDCLTETKPSGEPWKAWTRAFNGFYNRAWGNFDNRVFSVK